MRIFLLASLILLAGCTASAASATVLSAVDGDTLLVTVGGKEEHVRIVGIDTPETVDPRKSVQCYGPEASQAMHAFVDGKPVRLVRKPDEDRDKYGRLLRYVELGDVDIGAQMIARGYAVSYTFFPHPRLSTYNALEKGAKEAHRGLWGACRKR